MLALVINKFSNHQPYFTVLNTIQNKEHTPKYVKINKQDQESINILQHAIIRALGVKQLCSNLSQDTNITCKLQYII